MNDRTNLVFKGFADLNSTERDELVKEINAFLKEDSSKRMAINESLKASVSKMDLGPMGGTCPCCGR